MSEISGQTSVVRDQTTKISDQTSAVRRQMSDDKDQRTAVRTTGERTGLGNRTD